MSLGQNEKRDKSDVFIIFLHVLKLSDLLCVLCTF